MQPSVLVDTELDDNCEFVAAGVEHPWRKGGEEGRWRERGEESRKGQEELAVEQGQEHEHELLTLHSAGGGDDTGSEETQHGTWFWKPQASDSNRLNLLESNTNQSIQWN